MPRDRSISILQRNSEIGKLAHHQSDAGIGKLPSALDRGSMKRPDSRKRTGQIMGARVDRHVGHAFVDRLEPLSDGDDTLLHRMGSLRPRCDQRGGAKLEIVAEDRAADNTWNRGWRSHGQESQVDRPGTSGLRAAARRWANPIAARCTVVRTDRISRGM